MCYSYIYSYYIYIYTLVYYDISYDLLIEFVNGKQINFKMINILTFLIRIKLEQ